MACLLETRAAAICAQCHENYSTPLHLGRTPDLSQTCRAGGVYYKGTVRAVLREPPGPHVPPPERALYDPWDSVEVRPFTLTSCVLSTVGGCVPCGTA